MTHGLPGWERLRHGGLLPDGEAEAFGGFPAPAGRTAAAPGNRTPIPGWFTG